MRIPDQSKLLRSLGPIGICIFAEAIYAQFSGPKALQPPEGQVLITHLNGKGKQIYTCRKVVDAYAFKLKAPDAKLYAQDAN
jgi:hypothetical protein